MLGSGIFVLPGIGYDLTGPSLFIAFFLAAVCILPAAVSKSELATAMPTSGGTYVYLDRTFGPLAGTVAGLGLYLSLLLKVAFALVGFAAYLSVLTNANIQLTALCLLTVIVLVNIFGVSKASSFVTVILIGSISSLLALAFKSSFHIEPTTFNTLFPKGSNGLLAATALVFVAFAGVTKVAAIAEEIKNPKVNLPRGILFSLLIVAIMYSGLTFIMAGVLSPEEFSGNLRPIYTLADKVGNKAIGIAAVIISILTMTSMANAGILAASRFPFAMGRDKLLPSVFCTIHPRFLTPVFSIIISGVVVALSILFLNVEKIAKLASAFMITIYLLENIAVMVLRESHVQWYKPAYKSFAYPLLQLFGIASCSLLLFYMGAIVPLAMVSICIPGIILYIFFSRKRMDRKGVLGIRGPRKDLMEDPAHGVKNLEEFLFTKRARCCSGLIWQRASP